MLVWPAVVVVLALARVSLVAYPRVVFEGGAVRIECRVARHEANRWLRFGIEDLRVSTAQLDGADAAVIHTLLVTHLPCGRQVAFCQLEAERRFVDTAPVEVVGCAPR